MRLTKIKLALVDKDHFLSNRGGINDASGQWQNLIKELTGNLRSCSLDRQFERKPIRLVIDDTNKEYQEMMANATNCVIENKTATIYFYEPDEVTLRETIVGTIVGWSRNNNDFTIEIEQNFAGKLPQTPMAGEKKISTTDWPHAPQSSRGKEVIYPMGVIYRKKGGMGCWKIDVKPAAKYLLTWSDPAYAARVQSIQGIWQCGTKIATTKYSLVRDANGWEYVLFGNGTAGTIRANITANASLFSAGNPVDSLNEGLASIGITLTDASDTVKTWCTNSLWTVLGAPTELGTVKEYITLWCQNFDCFQRLSAAGAVEIFHFDWSSIASVATLGDRHFKKFSESSTMDGFYNRTKAYLDYNYADSEWGSIQIVSSTTASILPGTTPYEQTEEYAIADFAGTVKPMISKLKYVDHPLRTIDGSIDADTYKQLGLAVLSVVTVTHRDMIGGTAESGKYLILSEEKDLLENNMIVKLHRLWGA